MVVNLVYYGQNIKDIITKRNLKALPKVILSFSFPFFMISSFFYVFFSGFFSFILLFFSLDKMLNNKNKDRYQIDV